MIEYNSFYGGREGASFVLKCSYKTIDEMVAAFKQGGDYTLVNYGEYVLIDTANKNDIDNGKLYRRGHDYMNDIGGAIYIGQIVGPTGPAPFEHLTTMEDAKNRAAEAERIGREFETDSGEYNVTNTDILPGKDGDTYNDTIQWYSCSIRDANGIDTDVYLAFKFPYTVIEFNTQEIEPYKDGSRADTSKIERIDDATHPFYEKWKIYIPHGVKGDAIKNFRIYTPTKNESLFDNQGEEHTLLANKAYLIYDFYDYDEKQNGDPKTLYLGVYDMVKDITVSDNGTITITYTNKDTTTYNKMLKYITSVTLTEKGVFTVNYNNDRSTNGQGSKYTTNLKWVRNLALAEDGTVTLTYNDTTTTDLNQKIRWPVHVNVKDNGEIIVTYNDNSTTTADNHIRWINKTEMSDNGTITVKYNDSTQDTFESAVKWVTDMALANDGKLTVTYNDGNDPQTLNILKWLTGSSYNNSTGKLTFTYNTGDTEQYTYKYINEVTLTDKGIFTVKDNTGATYLTKTLEFPTQITLTDAGKFTITANTGKKLLEKDLKWPISVSINDQQKVEITYNDGTVTAIGEPLNYIMDTKISNDYHLLILHSAPAKRAALKEAGLTREDTYNGTTYDYQDMGIIKDYDGILVGFNIDSSTKPELDSPTYAVPYLNTQYPNGLSGNNVDGKIITIGKTEFDKRFYAYDYQTKKWFYLGTINGIADATRVIAGKDTAEVEQKALDLPAGSLWFVIED